MTRFSRPPWRALTSAAAVTVAYAALGRLALMMEIAPGYAAAVWPAAGVAAIAVLIGGYRMAPAVWLGSFLLHLGTSFDPLAPGRSVAIAACLGLGAALEGCAAAALVKRNVGYPTSLQKPGDLFWLLVLAGPVASLIAPTIGSASLRWFGLLSPDSAPFAWFTWWVGDTIGVLVLAPVLLSFFAAPAALWRPMRTLLSLSMSVGSVLVIATFVRASAWERQQIESGLAERGHAFTQALRDSMARYVEIGAAAAQLHQTHPNTTAQENRVFSAGPLHRQPAIVALAWLPRVERGDLLAFERDHVTAAGEPLSVWQRDELGHRVPVLPRDRYFPVLFVEPTQSNASAFGFDVSFESSRRTLLTRAARDGEPTLTPPVRQLVVRNDGKATVLLLVPSFDAAMPPSQRGLDTIEGFVSLGVRLDDLVQQSAGELRRDDISLSLTDLEGGALFGEALPTPPAGSWHQQFQVVDRQWQVVLAPSLGGSSGQLWQAWLVLVGGLFGIGLLGAILLSVSGNQHRLAAAEARYRDLYDHSPDFYALIDAVDGRVLHCNQTLATALQLPREQIAGRAFADLHVPAQRATAAALLAHFVSGGQLNDEALDLLAADGTALEVSLNMSAVVGQGGTITQGRAVWRSEAERRRSERDELFLVKTAELFQSIDDPDVLMREVSCRVAGHLGVAGCCFVEIDLARDRMVLHPGFASGQPMLTGEMPLSRFSPEAADALRRGVAMVNHDVTTDPRSVSQRAAYAAGGVRAYVGVPFMRAGTCVSSLWVIVPQPRAWLPHEIAVLQSMGDKTWLWVEKLRIARAARVGEAKYRRIVETANEGIWLIDRERRTVFVNRSLGEMLGYSPDEMIGQPVTAFFDDEALVALRARLTQREQGVAEVYDLKLKHRDGREVWARNSTSPVTGEDGRYDGALAMMSDITERVIAERELLAISQALEQRVDERTAALQEQETRYRRLFEESPISLWEEDFSQVRAYLDELVAGGVVDLAAHLSSHKRAVWAAASRVRIVAVNAATLQLFQADSSEALIAAMPRMLQADAHATLRDSLLFMLKERDETFDAETLMTTVGGELRSVHFRLTVLPGSERSWSRVMVSMSDVTANKAAQRQMQTALKEKEVLLKEVHHRVKNNLQVISSLLNLQANHLGDPNTLALFGESQARVQSIALVHESLYQSKNLSHVDFDDYCRNLVGNLMHVQGAHARGIRSTVAAAGVSLGVDAAIPCGLIVNELVINALKYAFVGRAAGTVAVKLFAIEGGRLELSVADDGVGLPEALDPRKTTSLGLDLVFTFAQQLKASVEVLRQQGTTFIFRFKAGA